MSRPHESGKPLRRGAASRQAQGAAQYRSAVDVWKEKSCVGTVLRYCGMEGGAKASELGMHSARTSRGGVWVEVEHPSFPGPQPVWVADTYASIMNNVGGDLVGSQVKVTFRGSGADDIQNGYCHFIGSCDERYSHPDQQSSPVSVGAFQGATCCPESYAIFAGTEYTGEQAG